MRHARASTLQAGGFPDLAVANSGSGDVSILLNDGKWLGPSPPPGDGGRGPGAVHRPRTPPASLAVSVEELVRVDPSVPATTPPPAAALPRGDVNLPLLGADAAKGWTRAAGAAVPAPQPPAPVLARARAEGTARGLTDRLFAAWESGWLSDRSADPAWWSGV